MNEVLRALKYLKQQYYYDNLPAYKNAYDTIKNHIITTHQDRRELLNKIEKLTNELYETKNEYEKYNEGWKDAIDLFNQKLLQLVGEDDE